MRWGPPPPGGGLPLPPWKAVLVALAVAGLLAAPRVQGLGVGGADDKGCPGASNQVGANGTDEARVAVLCLINRTRAEHGVPPLRESVALEVASIRHSKDMAERHYFEHVTPDGVDPSERMAAAGYTRPRRGENIAYGSGDASTPAEIMDGWMHSPGHRRNILNPDWVEIGIGVVRDTPGRGANSNGVTYTTDFGG